MSRWESQPNPQEQPDDELHAAEELETQAAAQRLSLPDNEEQQDTSNERLQYIENLLRKAPLVSVGMGFAERVMAALRRQEPDNPDYRDGVGIVLGLLISLVFVLSVIGLPTYLFLLAVLSTDRQQAIDDTSEFLADQSKIIGDFLLNPPILVVLTLAVLGSMTLALFVIRFMRDLLA